MSSTINNPLNQLSPRQKFLLGGCVIGLTAIAFIFLYPYLSFDYIKQQHLEFQQFHAEHPLLTVVIFIVIYVILTGMALPAAGAMMMLSGALFGFVQGTIITTVASTAGAVVVFLWSRYFFRDWVESQFSSQLTVINQGLEKEGGYYLFSIRMVAVFPFFIVNLITGVTALKLSTYIIATAPAQLVASAVLNFAGMQLSQINSLNEIMSLKTVSALAVIGLTPLLIHRTFAWRKSRSVQS